MDRTKKVVNSNVFGFVESKFSIVLCVAVLLSILFNAGVSSFAERPPFVITSPKIAAGVNHSLALKSDGTVWAWGDNHSGQLGDGSTMHTHRDKPVKVSRLSGVCQIAAGSSHNLALKKDGTVWAWGRNRTGQLGDGTTVDNRYFPVQVNGLSGVCQIAAGGSHSLALKKDGTVWAWGNNRDGQLGDGTIVNSHVPVEVVIGRNVSYIAAGWRHSLAVDSFGAVLGWGYNKYGQLGVGTIMDSSYFPVFAVSHHQFKKVAAGGRHSLALKQDGTVWAFGSNHHGQLGDGTITDRDMPVQISGLSGVSDIVAGAGYSLALKKDGTVWAWGWNHYGQLGNGTTNSRMIPGDVWTEEGGLTNFKNVSYIAAGTFHALAIKKDGTVWAWGHNDYGQLGDETRTDRHSPLQILNLYLRDRILRSQIPQVWEIFPPIKPYSDWRAPDAPSGFKLD